MSGWISNIRVSAKLSWGFGLVLGLTLLLAATGWYAVVKLTDRGLKVEEIAQISDYTKDLRIIRLRIGKSTQADAFQPLQQTLDRLATHLDRIRAQFIDPRDNDLIRQQQEAVNEYGKLLKDLATPDVDQASLFKRMGQLGDLLLDTTQKLIDSQNTKRDTDAASAKTLLSLVATLALLLGALAAWVITRQIVNPLQHTLQAVNRIARGDLTEKLTVTRRDELGQLQSGLQQMMLNLHELIDGIRSGVIQVASAAEQLSAVTEQTNSGINNQKAETDHVATAMNEMTATVHNVARNAEEASVAASIADQQASEGEQIVGEAIAQIQRLATELNQSADEVRNLALRTQRSTEEIESLVAGVQSGTQAVASGMDSSLQLSESSVECTHRAVSALENITGKVSIIQSMNQQIATAAEQQSAVTEEINRAVINVRDISDQTANTCEETAASSNELARLGHELERLVERFKV
ncbi:methyl-accepting chemotaxis protein [Pseudomonas extremaustralis]|uniref:HAMP domain-containing protein n=1 Tax=Pseudomonas extremaustralis TaxID=359110 RepID=A0A5C5QLD9_9PSED|nr:methyl-accepting chemotaxis protein [Pseudomonas extremaustralis]EZI27226.1 chemotaxis protein [Pseudomonas extremaustralis 14-3 substr. 14-3b]TWS06136.1 HAMP domain-containing protein [Pseudomonas extremaustralis]SDE73827.1 methyl-accepting chemotaxis protein [Pseudomonas extremaustralis]